MSRLAAAAATSALFATIGIASAIAAPGDLGTQRQISVTGPNANTPFPKRHALAYNPSRNQYLVVWSAPAVAQEDMEIFGRVLGPGGEPVGTQFQISSIGADGNNNFRADHPAVTYNSTADEYLVAWDGDDNTPPLADDENEIFVQRLSATGAEVGADDQRISTMGPDGSTAYGAFNPSVSFDPLTNEYLVAMGRRRRPARACGQRERDLRPAALSDRRRGRNRRCADLDQWPVPKPRL